MPSDQAFERHHQLEVAAAERLHLVGQATAAAGFDETVDEGGVVAVEIEPDHDAVLAHPAAQIGFEGLGDRSANG